MNLARFSNVFFLRPNATVAFCFSLLITAGAAATAQAADPPTAGNACLTCHEDQQKKLTVSAHANLTCDTCHDQHDKYPHPAGVAKPLCTNCHQEQADAYERSVHGQTAKAGGAAPDCGVCHGSAHELLKPSSAKFRMAVPDTCAMCHDGVVAQFRSSVHGQALARGITQAPLCTDCHGEHSILKHTNAASPVNSAHIRDTCGSCHGNVRLSRKFGLPADRIVSFDSSFHGLAAKAGNQTVANCASCHGVHNILPSSDPKSTISAKNLPATCGRCHPGAGQRFAISQVHVQEGKMEPAAGRWVRQFYLIVIPVTIGLMLLHHLGDWIRKLLRLRARKAPPYGLYRGHHVRMYPLERVQHAVMALSFIVLVITGFALKYPDQFWARPWLLGGGSMRSLVHRIAAGALIAVSLAHAISLAANRKLREHWLELLPRLSDAREAVSNFAYNIGLLQTRPHRSSHSYIEKAEYWAVVWGTLVMVVTGCMLWANNLALQWLPKSWLDVATSVHFYEAILATLAILVWHFYSVIFDPEVYPLDTAFLTGTSVRAHEPEPEEDAEEAETAGVGGD